MRDIGWKRMAFGIAGLALAGLCYWLDKDASAVAVLTGILGLMAPAALRAAKP